MNDCAGEEDVPAGKPGDRLVGVVDGAIDAVAETEFPREMHREPAGLAAEPGSADLVDEPAVVRGGELSGHGLFHVEALPEDEWLSLRHAYFIRSRTCGVMSSSALSVLTRGSANRSESSSSSSCEIGAGVISPARAATSGAVNRGAWAA